MARTKNRNPRPAYPTTSPSPSASAAPASSMAAAAAVASSLSAQMSPPPLVVPTEAPHASLPHAPSPASPIGPTAALPTGQPPVGVTERAQKNEMRVAAGNMTEATASGVATAGPSTAVGSPSATAPRRSGPPRRAAVVMPPVAHVGQATLARRATTAEKGKGTAKAAKTVIAPAPGAAAPRAARRLAVIAPRPGSKPFATLEFRNARSASWAVSGAAAASGAGMAESSRPSLAASAKDGVWAVGGDVVRPTPLYRKIVAKGVASVSQPTSLDIRQMATQSSDDEGGLAAPPPSPTSAVMAVVEPTNALMKKIRENRKRNLDRSRSRSADKGDALLSTPAVVSQVTNDNEVSIAPLPASRAAATAGAKVLENDINKTLETLLSHIDDVEARLEELAESSMLVDEKMDAAINLTQQTLMHVAAMGEKLSKEMKDGFYKVRFVVSGTTNAAVDEAPEKTIDIIRKFLREDLDDDWVYTNVTSEVYPDTNAYWDKAVRATSTAIKSGAEGAEVFLRSMVHLPSRKDPSVYVRMRASVPVLRVKSHMHKWYGELIWAAFVSALMPINEVVTVEIAKQLRKDHRYVCAVLGKKACISAATKLCAAVGAFGRIKEPKAAGDPQVLEVTLGHFAFVTMKVRNMVERLSGERTVVTVGGDGHYSMWVEEVRFLHDKLPKDEEAHDGLRLVDGASVARSLPWIGEASASE